MADRSSILKGAMLAATLIGGAVFQSCESDGGSASPIAPAGGKGNDSLAPLLLFQGEHPALQGDTPALETGMAKTATGKLNPLVFAVDKNPLQKAGSRLAFNLFENATFTAVVESSQTLGPGRFVAFGRIEGNAGATFIANCEGATLTALVTVPGAGVFRVENIGEDTYRAVLQNDFAPACPPAPAPKVVLDTSYHPVVLKKTAAAGPVIVDIMILYTAAAVAGAKSLANMNALADAAVAQANEAYRNSKIDLTLNLVHRGQVNYAESGSIDADLARLQSSNDAFLAEAHTLRNTYGADIVTLITETGEAQWAGLGYVMTSVNPAYKDYAFNVVRRAYASGYSVLAHEIGHNMGCMHDPGNSSFAGAYAYSHGHRWNGTDNVQYRDLMAYSPGKPINYFSNPSVLYKGVATGLTGAANTALTIANTISIVEAYRPRSMPGITLISPTEGSVLMAPANVILNAVTSGSPLVAKVEFYNGTVLLGTDLTAPYSYVWNPVDSGGYTLTAKVYTKSGLTATSAPVRFSTGSIEDLQPFTDVFIGAAGINTPSKRTGGADPRITITGIAAGITGKADALQFLSMGKWEFDGNLTSLGISLSGTSATTVAGLMVRESMAPGARCLFIAKNGLGDPIFLKRTVLNGAITATKIVSTGTPRGLQVIRKGNDIACYRTDDGRNWVLLAGMTMLFPNGAYFGLAVSGGTVAAPNVAEFRDAEYNIHLATSRPADFPPFVSLISPLSGSTFNQGTPITFTTTASDRDGAADLIRMDFYNTTLFAPEPDDPSRLGTDIAAPYSFTWTATAGTAHIKARIEDAIHYDTYSNVLTLNILGTGERMGYPVADASVADGKYANTNYGTGATITARSNPTAGSTTESHLYFRIDSLPSIAHATLRLYGNVLGGTGSVKVAAAGVDSVGWLESGTKTGLKNLTWSTRPPAGSRIAAKTVSGATGQWYEFDVTDHVKTRKAAGKSMAGFVLQGVDSTAAYASFASRTAAAGKPELILSDH